LTDITEISISPNCSRLHSFIKTAFTLENLRFGDLSQ
jgi:hypothetical protein